MVAGNQSSLWDDLCKRSEKVNGEFVILTYGALVAQVCQDFPDPHEATRQLERIGRNIGYRMIDDFLAKAMNVGLFGYSGGYPKRDLKCVCEYLRLAFRYYLSVDATVTMEGDEREANFTLDCNPFQEHVEIPAELKSELQYSALLCGIVVGALESLQIGAEVRQLDVRNFRLAMKSNECESKCQLAQP